MSLKTITTTNASGQTASFGIVSPRDEARAEILRARIGRGELAEGKSRKDGDFVDPDAGAKDEKGDYLKSIHGGGIDPDADGDALGQPSGSNAPAKAQRAGKPVEDQSK